MNVIETTAEGLKRAYQITVPAADVDDKITAKLKELAKTVQLPGFRPGKAPVPILRKRFGKAVLGEVLEATISESTQSVIQEKGLRPALQPSVDLEGGADAIAPGRDLVITMELEVLPEVEPVDLASIELEKWVADVPEERIDDGLVRLAATRKAFATVTRAAELGDQVMMDFEGRLEGGDVEPGMSGQDHALELGSNMFIPGFEEQLIGISAGDQKTVSVTFPDDYGSQTHAGKTGIFEVTAKEVKAPEEAGVDDALGVAFGFEDLAGLRQAVREQTEAEFGKASRARAKRALLDLLADRFSFDVPAGMVDVEFSGIWRQIEEELDKHKKAVAVAEDKGEAPPAIDPDLDKSEAALRQEYHDIAVRRVRLGLVLSDIGTRHGVQISEEDMQRAVVEEARKYRGQEREVMEFFSKNQQAMESLRAPLFEDKVVDYILELANVTEKTVTPEELTADPDAEPEDGDTTPTQAETTA